MLRTACSAFAAETPCWVAGVTIFLTAIVQTMFSSAATVTIGCLEAPRFAAVFLKREATTLSTAAMATIFFSAMTATIFWMAVPAPIFWMEERVTISRATWMPRRQ